MGENEDGVKNNPGASFGCQTKAMGWVPPLMRGDKFQRRALAPSKRVLKCEGSASNKESQYKCYFIGWLQKDKPTICERI